jgi:hypothetical protein
MGKRQILDAKYSRESRRSGKMRSAKRRRWAPLGDCVVGSDALVAIRDELPAIRAV